ncbi:MAG: thiamine-binding protein [Acidimicrobiales bacterium]
MPLGRIEILVEPFKENAPGPHVLAVLDLVRSRGFNVDMGPFSSTIEGELTELIALTSELLQAGFDAGATSIQTRIERA